MALFHTFILPCTRLIISCISILFQVTYNYASLFMFDILPLAAYILSPYVAVIVWILTTKSIDVAAQSYQDFDAVLNFMRGKCISRKSFVHRKLESTSTAGFHIILGGVPHQIRRMSKIHYRAAVLDFTVWLVLTLPRQ